MKIFLMIGLTKESQHWDDEFVSQLQKQFKPSKIVAFDTPGTGAMLKDTSPITVSKIAERIRNHYKSELETDEHKLLISLSLGGMISIEWLRMHPGDFDSFVIINSSVAGLSPIHRRVQPRGILEFFKIFLARNDHDREEKILKLCSNNPDRHAVTHKKWVEIAKDRAISRKNTVLQTLAGGTFRYKSGMPKIPHLIIAAKHDRLAHYTCSARLHEKWGGEFQLFSDKHIGHAFHIDAPVELAQTIQKWHAKHF